jgi:hypothetical protein
MRSLQRGFVVLLVWASSTGVTLQQQASMAEAKLWLESEAPKSLRVVVAKTSKLADLTRIEETSVTISDVKLDRCALSWTKNDVKKTTFEGKNFVSQIHFQSTNVVPLEDIQPTFTRVDIDRAVADEPVHLVYLQTSRPTISVVSHQIDTTAPMTPSKLPQPKTYAERSARLFVTTLDDAHRITDMVLRAAALCGAK